MSTTLWPLLLIWLPATVLPLGALWALFWLVLRREQCFGYNRALLLLAPALAALLPLLPRPDLLGSLWAAPAGSAGSAGAVVGGLLPGLRVSPAPAAGGWAGELVLLGLYAAGVLALLARLTYRLWRLRRLRQTRPTEARPGFRVVYTGGELPTSSFGRTVFWDETADLRPGEAPVVLAHELAHVRQRHTHDVLWLEIWRAVLWPNPFAHLLLPALRLTHELLADRAALLVTAHGLDGESSADQPAALTAYAALLARLATRSLTAPPATALTQTFTSFTLIRLAMLQNPTPVRRWKQWLALPLVAVLFAVAGHPASAQMMLGNSSTQAERQAWKEQVMKNIAKALRADSLTNGGAKTFGQRQRLRLAIRRDATIGLELTHKTGLPPSPKMLNGSSDSFQVKYDHPDVIGVFGASGKLSNVVTMRAITEFVEQLAQRDRTPDRPNDSNEPKVYTFVEQMPELPTGGGNTSIVQAIQDKLIYPKAAASSTAATEGRVFVSFTVAADGLVVDPKVVKTLGPAYDEAVLVAIRQLPRFRPGQQQGRAVAVSFTVPVMFKPTAGK